MSSIKNSNQIRDIEEILSSELGYFGSPNTKNDSLRSKVRILEVCIH